MIKIFRSSFVTRLPATKPLCVCRGAEWGTRKFEIYIDDQKPATEDSTGKCGQLKFINTKYAIPEAVLKGKDRVRVKCQAPPGASVGPVYDVRLVKTAQP